MPSIEREFGWGENLQVTSSIATTTTTALTAREETECKCQTLIQFIYINISEITQSLMILFWFGYFFFKIFMKMLKYLSNKK